MTTGTIEERLRKLIESKTILTDADYFPYVFAKGSQLLQYRGCGIGAVIFKVSPIEEDPPVEHWTPYEKVDARKAIDNFVRGEEFKDNHKITDYFPRKG